MTHKREVYITDTGDSSVGIGSASYPLELTLHESDETASECLDALVDDPAFKELIKKHFQVDFRVIVYTDKDCQEDSA